MKMSFEHFLSILLMEFNPVLFFYVFTCYKCKILTFKAQQSLNYDNLIYSKILP
jgi:hypothetical protein